MFLYKTFENIYNSYIQYSYCFLFIHSVYFPVILFGFNIIRTIKCFAFLLRFCLNFKIESEIKLGFQIPCLICHTGNICPKLISE